MKLITTGLFFGRYNFEKQKRYNTSNKIRKFYTYEEVRSIQLRIGFFNDPCEFLHRFEDLIYEEN